MRDAMPALRVSNAIAIVLLFLGRLLARRYSGLRPWRTGLAMVGDRRRARRPHDRARRMSALARDSPSRRCARAARAAALGAGGRRRRRRRPKRRPAWEFSASLYGYFPPDDRHYAQPTVIANHGAPPPGGPLQLRGPQDGLRLGRLERRRRREAPPRRDADGRRRLRRHARRRARLRADRSRTAASSSTARASTSSTSRTRPTTSSTTGRSSATRRSTGSTVGLASQRTRAYQTGLDVQRGVFVGFTCKSVTLNVYVFNPGWETPTVVSSLAVSF